MSWTRKIPEPIAGSGVLLRRKGGKLLSSLFAASTVLAAWSANASEQLNRLILVSRNTTPLYKVLSFGSVAAVANYYGSNSTEAKLAGDYFAGYHGDAAHLLFTRLPVLPDRAHLYGANVGGLTLGQWQAIDGTLSMKSEGYAYSASVNLAGAPDVATAVLDVQNALNARLPIAAVTTGSSIAPVTTTFTAQIGSAWMRVTSAAPGSIKIGATVDGTQITTQLKGTPGGKGVYGLFLPEPVTPVETMTASYGLLTVGSVASGKVAVGQEVAQASSDPSNPNAVPTAIESHVSGHGAGSTWVVNMAQTTPAENMTMTGPPLSVLYRPVTGGTRDSASLVIQQGNYFNWKQSRLSYVSGTIARELGLTKSSGAFDSTPGKLTRWPAKWLSNFVQTKTANWSSFQISNLHSSSIPGLKRSFATWARESDGRFHFLANYGGLTSTSPIERMVRRLAASSAGTAGPAGASTSAVAPTPPTPHANALSAGIDAYLRWRFAPNLTLAISYQGEFNNQTRYDMADATIEIAF